MHGWHGCVGLSANVLMAHSTHDGSVAHVPSTPHVMVLVPTRPNPSAHVTVASAGKRSLVASTAALAMVGAVHDTPRHTGAAFDHVPSVWHDAATSPTSSYPGEQKNSAVAG